MVWTHLSKNFVIQNVFAGEKKFGTLSQMNKDKVLQIRFPEGVLASLRKKHGKKLCEWAREVICAAAPSATSSGAQQSKPD